MQVLSEKQKEVIRTADARWNLMTGAVRSGKTYGSFFLLPKRIVEQGEGNFMLIGKTERTLRRNIIDPLRELYGSKYISTIYGDGLVNLFGRKAYVVGANDERSVTKIQGIGLVYAYGDEVTTWPESFFQMLKSRLDKPGAKFDGTCNPEGPYHWLKKDFIDKEGLNLNHYHFTIDDNPFLDLEFVRALKSEYTGVWYDRYIKGLWVMAEGVIYSVIDPKIHHVSKLPSMLKYWVGIDYGTSNATAFIMIGLGVDGNFYICKEYYHAGGSGVDNSKTDLQYARDFIEWLGKIVPRWIFVDPSAKSFRVQLWQLRHKHKALGKVAIAGNKVVDGIRTTNSMYGTKKLFIYDKCKHVIEESGSYCWDAKAQSRGEDKPLKEYDHTMDAIRYACVGIFNDGYHQILAA